MTERSEKPSESPAEQFALIVDAVQDYAIFLLDSRGNIESWNGGAARIFGYEEREIVGRHFSQFYLPDDLKEEKPQRELDGAARAGRFEDDGWRLRKDGTRFWASTVITVLKDEAGAVRGFAKITRDMTARRAAEEELRESSEVFQLLVGSVRDYSIFMLDPEGNVATWNSGAEQIKGYKPHEIIGRHFSTFYDEEDLRNGKPERELRIAREQGRVEDEGWRIRKDGSRFWANVVITAIYDSHGELRGFAKVTRDITARRAAEEDLRQSAETFQLLVSSVRDYAIFMLDPEGRILTWNSGARRIKGYAPSEIIGRHFSQFYGEEDVRNGKPQRELEIAREHGSVEDEGWRVRKDGSRFWANVVITAVYDAQGSLRGFAKVTRDLTDRKQAEEAQRALLEQREARVQAEEERRRAEDSYRVSQEANRAKDEFLMTLSHELRTPMTAVLGWARLLTSMSADDPLFQEAIASIGGAAKLQARLIDDLLDVSRIVSGKLRLTPEIVDLARLIRIAVDSVRATADAKEITLTAQCSPALGSTVADATRLQQVLWNLLANAVKFTPRRGAVQVSARRTGSDVEIAVSDNGEGIDPKFLPHMFEPFRQGESPTSRIHGGLGLGLAIVRYIAEAHGGSVTAESRGRGKGSTFLVTLPVRAASVAEGAADSVPGSTFLDRDRLRGIDIVLVDDDSESRKVVAAVLRAAGATVTPFDSPQPALIAIDGHRPDIVITDIAMPEIDGHAFTRAMRERHYGGQLKIVALSAFPPAADSSPAFDAHFSKPIEPFQFIEDIGRIVARRGA
jgi:PAS domain S-box-containing protein